MRHGVCRWEAQTRSDGTRAPRSWRRRVGCCRRRCEDLLCDVAFCALHVVSQATVLFEELFYNDAYKSFRVLCVDRPVEGPQSQIAAAGADEVPPSPQAPFTPNKTTHAHARTHTHARAHRLTDTIHAW